MSTDFKDSIGTSRPSKTLLVQSVTGSRRISNFIVSSMVSIGGIGFLLASVSSFLGEDLLPLGKPSELIFVPQGLVMGLYGIAASFLAIYLWILIAINFGAGINSFDKGAGVLSVTRRGLLKQIQFEIPLKDVKAVKLDVRDGLNPRRRILLRLQGRSDLPITKVGDPLPLIQLEQAGAELARFLEVTLEGL